MTCSTKDDYVVRIIMLLLLFQFEIDYTSTKKRKANDLQHKWQLRRAYYHAPSLFQYQIDYTSTKKWKANDL